MFEHNEFSPPNSIYTVRPDAEPSPVLSELDAAYDAGDRSLAALLIQRLYRQVDATAALAA